MNYKKNLWNNFQFWRSSWLTVIEDFSNIEVLQNELLFVHNNEGRQW